MSENSHVSLYDEKGLRLYLTPEEREAFLAAAKKADRQTRTFCHALHTTGGRISEILSIQPQHVDFSRKVIVLETLKKRRRGVYRAVPVPEDFLDALDMVHGLKELQKSHYGQDRPLWGWVRMTGYRKIVAVMAAAGIEDGPHKCPKGLRHAFGINAVLNNTPLNMLKKWMGHATIETTAIYADAVGEEEREIASRMW